MVGISGTWRILAPEVEGDVRAAVQKIHADGKGVICGGAMGVDFFAADEMLKLDPTGESVLILLAMTIEAYAARLDMWATKQGTEASRSQADAVLDLFKRLTAVRPESLVIGPAIDPMEVTEEVYLAINDRIVELADELMAFQVNKSSGTQDAIDKMRAAGKPVTIHTYIV